MEMQQRWRACNKYGYKKGLLRKDMDNFDMVFVNII